jgi:SAM-dependent methyltransferase
MKKWILKAIIQKGISFLPAKHKINFLFQKYITKGVQLRDAYFEDKLMHTQKHLGFYHEFSTRPFEGTSVLELGTGWYPVVPIAQYLCGARRITSVDISPLMNRERIITTIDKFVAYARQGKLQSYLPHLSADKLARLQQLQQQPLPNMADYLSALHMEYLVADARRLPFDDNSIDFITSNNVFEHIYPDILKDILAEFERVLHKEGLMSHFIDMSDHFAHLDKSITIYNFLQFTEQQWQAIDNSIQPQNRWRINQYRELYDELNIPILKEEARPGFMEQVQAMRLSPPFSHFDKKEVAISHCYVVSDKKASS